MVNFQESSVDYRLLDDVGIYTPIVNVCSLIWFQIVGMAWDKFPHIKGPQNPPRFLLSPSPSPQLLFRAAHFFFINSATMTTSKRVAEKKVAKFEKNITKRGLGPMASKKMKTELYVLAFFVVVVVGSFIFQIVRLALTG
ncbi:unnamed protein product [Lactuca virosa]|uniref:Stress-associated endoplasmic reticulum protein n=1 Tax=Lactuca virosa TaxID=75947 RepID=A0AAU9MY27_9ASTR|nr:unnamed protein product [Lactuca virosa]